MAIDSSKWRGVHPDGKIGLILGQDADSIKDYVGCKQFPTPMGLSSYLALPDTEGLWDAYDYGAGPMDATSLATEYPDSLLDLGVYMVEDETIPNRLTRLASARGEDGFRIAEIGNFIVESSTFKYGNDYMAYPIMLRLGYEFDWIWHDYDPQKYKDAYRKVAEIIKNMAPNAIFVWQACASPLNDLIRKEHRNPMDWFPGDEYVDMVGFSWFLSGGEKQLELANEMLNIAREKNKPAVISEAAPQGFDLSGVTSANISPIYDGDAAKNVKNMSGEEIWKEWFQPWFAFIYKNSDVLRYVSYINCNWNEHPMWGEPYQLGYWGNSRIQDNEYISKRWQEEMAKDIWAHGSVENLAAISKTLL